MRNPRIQCEICLECYDEDACPDLCNCGTELIDEDNELTEEACYVE